MEISVLIYCLHQDTIEHVSNVMSQRNDYDANISVCHLQNRFCVSVHANSTYIVTHFATKPSRKQISRCISNAIKTEKQYQAEHKVKFGWCRV